MKPVDHVGRNTMVSNGKWAPASTKARYLVTTCEFDHWRALHVGDAPSPTFADSVQPLLDAGLIDRVAPDRAWCDEVRLVPTR